MFPEIPLPSFLKKSTTTIEERISECYEDARAGVRDEAECDELLASNTKEETLNFVNNITSDTGILVLAGVFLVIVIVWALAHAIR